MADAALEPNIVCFRTTGEESLCIFPSPDGDVAPENKVVVTLAEQFFDRYDPSMGKLTLASLLKDDKGKMYVDKVLAPYGLSSEVLETMMGSKDPNEKKLISAVAGLSYKFAISRKAAIKELQAIGGPVAFSTISGRGIYDPDPIVRIEAVNALCALDSNRAKPFLKAVFLHDPDKNVRVAASNGLREEDIDATPVSYKGLITQSQLNLENVSLVRRGLERAMRKRTREMMLDAMKEAIFK